MRLILVRHGQTPSNVDHHLDTAEPGPGLTDLGQEQARALPGTLDAEPIEAVFASTLVRTQQTAGPLARALDLDVRVRSGLREITAGAMEMANDEESIQTYLSIALGWADGAPDVPMPGTEQDAGVVLGRFDEVAREAHDLGLSTTVFVTHGAMIRAWTAARCDNISADFARTSWVSNTGAVVVAGEPGRWRVEQWQEQALGGLTVDEESTGDPAAEQVER